MMKGDSAVPSNEGKESGLREALAALATVRACLEVANQDPFGPICDTLWFDDHETLFDFIDRKLETLGASIPSSKDSAK